MTEKKRSSPRRATAPSSSAKKTKREAKAVPSSKSMQPRKALDPEVLAKEENEDLEDIEDIEPSDEEIASQLPARGAREPVAPDSLDPPTKAVSASDPLRRYMEEVRRHPLLDPHEEFALALRLRDQGDLDAAKRLVQANLRLVVKIAFEYQNYYSNLLDLVQEGNIGLMRAVSKFDPTKGARLGYYASWWIRSYILKYLLDNFRLVKIGTTQAQKKLFYHLMREKERIEAQGMLAGPKLLADRLNVREKDVVEMEQRLSSRGSEMSLDAPIVSADGESSTPLSAWVADEAEGTDDRLAREQLLQLIRDRIPEFQKNLDEKESRILRERILSEEPKTLQEVADLYGLTRERARQIEAKVITKLRDFLKVDLEPS